MRPGPSVTCSIWRPAQCSSYASSGNRSRNVDASGAATTVQRLKSKNRIRSGRTLRGVNEYSCPNPGTANLMNSRTGSTPVANGVKRSCR